MTRNLAILVCAAVLCGVLAWLPMFADCMGWVFVEDLAPLGLIVGPPFGVILIGHDVLVRPYLSGDPPFALLMAVWLVLAVLYYVLLFSPSGALLIRVRGDLSRWREEEGLVGAQLFFIVIHLTAAFLAMLMMRA